MASTDFIQINPNANNTEADAQYSVDPLVTGGSVPDAILPSPFWNKFAFQQSTFIAAFCTMLANKGYTTSDGQGIGGGFDALVAVLSTVRTEADFEDSVIQIPFATAVTFDAAQSAGFDLILTGNVSTSTLTNTSQGQVLTFIIQQDATGGRTFPWPSQLTTYPICPQPLSTSIQAFFVRFGGSPIIPVSPMLWIPASGVVIVQPTGTAIPISASGNVSNQYASLVEEVNCSGGPITRNLPTAVGYQGFTVNIKKVDTSTNAITVLPQAGQTIDGFSNYVIGNAYNSITFTSNGTGWIII